MGTEHYAREDEQPGEQIDELVEVLIVVGIALLCIGLLAWGGDWIEATLHLLSW